MMIFDIYVSHLKLLYDTLILINDITYKFDCNIYNNTIIKDEKMRMNLFKDI